MVASIVSPGVYIREKDFSQYALALSTSALGIVTSSSWGPVETPTLKNDEGTWIKTFGEPISGSYGAYCAIPYLRYGSQLWTVRVADTNKAKSTISIADSSSTNTLKIEGKYYGTRGDTLRVVIASGTTSGTFKITIQDLAGTTWVTLESFDNLKIGSSNTGDDDYCETRVNDDTTNKSEYITVEDLAGSDDLPTNGNYTLSGGNDGTASLGDSDYIGTALYNTGLKAFLNTEKYNINILAVPGISSAAVVSEILSICEDRADCIGLIDPPYGYSVNNVVDWHNGSFGGNSTRFNSSYGALYWPWVQMYDAYGAANAYVPPSGFVAGQYAYNDYQQDPWYAPAGYARGRLLTALDIEYSARQAERDTMYSGQNCVNPIINESTDGLMIYGQRTLQRSASALDRVNVRRMLLYMEKVVATTVKYLVFEPSDQYTWRRFTGLVEPVAESIKARRGIYGFRVVCDETTNTDELINQNKMAGKILIQPTKTAEMIPVDFHLLPSGAEFFETA